MNPRVQVIGWTEFFLPRGTAYGTAPDTKTGGEALVEFAGRACYRSFDRPNPATATNESYIGHILDVGHFSVLEHGNVTMYIEGVSRSFTHELVRHRHFSFSQLSQRYVTLDADVPERTPADFVVPPVFRGDVEAEDELLDLWERAVDLYAELVARAEQMHGVKRKQAREAARAVLPNMTPTAIVVTGNYRAWRHFIQLRATAAADAEMREVALLCLEQLRAVAPHVFQDFLVLSNDDGLTEARAEYGEVS
jgi:thymidylate synthase (FAD)